MFNIFKAKKDELIYRGVGKVGQLFGPDKYVHVYEYVKKPGYFKYKDFRNGLRV